jgi:small subunit ribosomal protein S17
MEKEAQKKLIGKKKGVVVSENAGKTIVVAVTSFKTHKKYKKKYKSTKKYKVHDEEMKFKKGDTVEIFPCRPMSKNKFYKVA